MSNKLACQLMSWFSIRGASLLPVAMLSTCTNQLDFRLVVIMCIFFQPLFEKVSNYACHIPWPCFQLFTFHSRSRGAPPLLWRRGGLALCWSMLLATKMGSSRPPQMFWFQSCFDFQVLTYWLLRSVCVCVCVWHQRFRELSNPRSFEAPLLLCIRRHDTYCALYDIHSIQSPSSVFFWNSGYSLLSYAEDAESELQSISENFSFTDVEARVSRLQGFLGLENGYPEILWNISLHLGTCTTWDPDIILHLTSRIFPSWSSSCPTCWQKWHAAQKSMISSWRCWSNLTWMLESFWANKSDVPISASSHWFTFKVSHLTSRHVMLCCHFVAIGQ